MVYRLGRATETGVKVYDKICRVIAPFVNRGDGDFPGPGQVVASELRGAGSLCRSSFLPETRCEDLSIGS